MQDQVTALGTLDDEIVRTCKRYETTLDQLGTLEKGHEPAFKLLRGVTAALDAKSKELKRSKAALLKLEGYLNAQSEGMAQLVATRPASVGQFFSTVIGRVRREAEEITVAMTTEVRLDLGSLARVIDNVVLLLGTEGALKSWRKGFDERTGLVESQSEHLVNAAKVAEQVLDKALAKLFQPSAAPGTEVEAVL
jgi:hypothetical protein